MTQVRRPISPEWRSAIDEYCAHMAAAGRRPETVKTRRSNLDFMARGIAASTPQAVTAVALVSWFSEQRWKPETRKSYRSAARGFFRWAYRRGVVSVNLVDEVESVSIPCPVPRPVPDQAWAEALAAADPRVRLMLRLAGEVGLRRAEVAQVHTSDVTDSCNGPQLTVRGKGGKVRVLPISDELAELIRQGAPGHSPELRAVGPRGFLFPGSCNGHLTPRWVGMMTASVLPPGYTLHKARHLFASRAYRGTRNLRAVQMLLGHSSIATTQVYTAVDDDEMRGDDGGGHAVSAQSIRRAAVCGAVMHNDALTVAYYFERCVPPCSRPFLPFAHWSSRGGSTVHVHGEIGRALDAGTRWQGSGHCVVRGHGSGLHDVVGMPSRRRQQNTGHRDSARSSTDPAS